METCEERINAAYTAEVSAMLADLGARLRALVSDEPPASGPDFGGEILHILADVGRTYHYTL